MRLIGDLEQPSAGSIRVRAKTPEQARRDREYGIVFQSPVLYEWRTIRRNVELPLEIMGRPRPQRRHDAQPVEQVRMRGPVLD